MFLPSETKLPADDSSHLPYTIAIRDARSVIWLYEYVFVLQTVECFLGVDLFYESDME